MIRKILKSELLLSDMKILHPQELLIVAILIRENLALYNDSEEGSLPRKKIRLRWYNNNKKFVKETKISSFEGRFKTTEKLENLNFSKILDYKFLDSQYGLVYPTIIVSYLREYFIQRLKNNF